LAERDRTPRPAPAPARIARFGRTERFVHWSLAITFFVMAGTGAALYAPALARILPRPEAKAIHLQAAVALGVAVLAAILLGNRRALHRDAREIDRFDDLRFLSASRIARGAPTPPQGRFNAGQKLNTALTLGLMVVLAATGVLLWYGEQDTRFRFAGSVLVHDIATMGIVVLVCGHLYMAVLNPRTRAALDGMTRGDVDRAWAREHHAKWVAEEELRSRPEEEARQAFTSGQSVSRRH
jgi:formate dehydrogenase subunit gamma